MPVFFYNNFLIEFSTYFDNIYIDVAVAALRLHNLVITVSVGTLKTSNIGLEGGDISE